MTSNLSFTKNSKWRPAHYSDLLDPAIFGFYAQKYPYMQIFALSAGSEHIFHISAPPYKKFRKRVVSELRTSRAAYYNQYFLTHKDNMKKLWSGIRSIINIKHKTTLNISQPVMDGIVVTGSKHIASAFNHYFVKYVPQQVDKAIPKTKKSPTDYLKDRNRNSIFLIATEPLKIETIIVF